MVNGEYQIVAEYADKKAGFYAAFPIAFNETGKQLLAGQVDGELVYVTGSSDQPVAAFVAALQDKVAELGALVADTDEALFDEVDAINMLVASGEYALAAQQADLLAASLPAGAAQTSALELSSLLQYMP
jgi:hypothetical protein